MTFSEGWHDQYQRMLRSRQRLVEAAGPSSMGSAEARDRLYHFFQDAYHLKDWLKNDLAVGLDDQAKGDLERHVTATDALARCADICNGTKHLTVKPRIPGKPAKLTNQSVNVMPATVVGRASFGGVPVREPEPTPPATAEHQWYMTFDGQKYDAVGLANEVVDEWGKWLKAEGHL